MQARFDDEILQKNELLAKIESLMAQMKADSDSFEAKFQKAINSQNEQLTNSEIVNEELRHQSTELETQLNTLRKQLGVCEV